MKWSKRSESLIEKGEFSPHALPISGWSLKETLGDSWHWQVSIIPWQIFAISRMRLRETAEQGSSLALCSVCHSFTQVHYRVSKVQQKTCLLGEQRTRAPSILTLSWRIPDEPLTWKVAAEPQKTPGFLASGGEEFHLRSVMRLDRSELLCNKVLLKYKGERESF